MNRIKQLVIRFNNPITHQEIPLFRGAVIHSMRSANILFHNHDGESFRYAYPFIQYKRINDKAAMVCIGEGTNAIATFFAGGQHPLRIGERIVDLEIEQIYAKQNLIQIWNEQFSYRMSNWLPLNSENYLRYSQSNSLVEKYALLEKILIGNILSFAKSLDITFEKAVTCHLTRVENPHIITYKEVKMMAFNVSFTCNISLPSFIGLGKGVSLGYGIIFN